MDTREAEASFSVAALQTTRNSRNILLVRVHYNKSSQHCSNKLSISLGTEGLWSFNRRTKASVDDELWQDAQGSRDTEEDSVVVGFRQTVVLQKHTRMLQIGSVRLRDCSSWDAYSVNIGVGVLGLAVLGQDTGSNLVNLADKFEHWVLWQLAESKLSLGHVSGISLAQNCVTIAWYNTARVQSRPEIVTD